MILLKKIIWYPVESVVFGQVFRNTYGEAIEISDAVDISANQSVEIKNNICELPLKNAWRRFVDGTPRSSYVTDGGEIRFREQDQFQVYQVLTDDAQLVQDWESTPISDFQDEFADDYLLGTYYLEEFRTNQGTASTRITIRAVDRMFLLFNKVFANEYGIANRFTAPGVIRDLVRYHSFGEVGAKYPGTHTDSGSKFFIRADFVSEGGNIQDRRESPATALDGALSDSADTITVNSTAGFKDVGTLVIGTEHIYYDGINGTQFLNCDRGIDKTVPVAHDSATEVYQGFPLLLFAKIWDPLFDWIEELSQFVNTNYLDELEDIDDLFYQRKFLSWIDREDVFHWRSPSEITAHVIDVGNDSTMDVYDFALDNVVFDAVNMVIYNVGEDMFGLGTVFYYFDENSRLSQLKMRYQPMTDIISKLVYEDSKDAWNPDRKDEPANDQYKKFPTDVSYPITDWFFKNDTNSFRASQGQSAMTSITNDSDYNQALRDAAMWRGRLRAIQITTKLRGLRYRGNISVPFKPIQPGDLVDVQNSFVGVNVKIRVVGVRHRTQSAQASTLLELEEDEVLIGAGIE